MIWVKTIVCVVYHYMVVNIKKQITSWSVSVDWCLQHAD